MREEDTWWGTQRTRWPGAAYVAHVDSKLHVRLLATARLGLLPSEIEMGRWHNVARENRLRSFGCQKGGDLDHFLHGCSALNSEAIAPRERDAADSTNDSPYFFFVKDRKETLMPMEGED